MASIANLLHSNPLVDKATVDNEQPTPGYLYSEINKLTFNGGSTNERLLGHLLVKLKIDSAAVKIKVLLIIKYLLEHGHPHFQKLMQQKVDDIRACLEYRAPPDPLRGDAPTRLVRDKAQAVMNLMYEVRSDASMELNTNSNEAQTMESKNFGALPVRSLSSSEPARGGQGYGGGPSSGFNRSTSSIEGGFRPVSKANTNNKTIVEDFLGSLKTGFGWNKPVKKPGPGPQTSYNPNQFSTARNYNSHKGLFAISDHTTTTTDAAFNSSGSIDTSKPAGGWDDGASVQDEEFRGTPEYALVDSFCIPPSNVRIQPSIQQVKSFIQQAQGLNVPLVCYLLVQQLSDQNWKKRLRALYAAHELVVADIQPSAEFFLSDSIFPALTAQSSSAQKTVRDKANQLIVTLNPDYQVTLSSSNQPEDGGDGNQDVDDTGSLFGDLQISDGSSTASPFGNGFNSGSGNKNMFVPNSGTAISLLDFSGTNSASIYSSGSTPVLPLASGVSLTPTKTTSQKQQVQPNNISAPQRSSSVPILPFDTNPSSADVTRPRQSSKTLLEPIFDPKSQQKVAQREIDAAYQQSMYYPGGLYPYPGAMYPGYPGAFNPLYGTQPQVGALYAQPYGGVGVGVGINNLGGANLSSPATNVSLLGSPSSNSTVSFSGLGSLGTPTATTTATANASINVSSESTAFDFVNLSSEKSQESSEGAFDFVKNS
eukprot:TRINITY_DN61_c2_g1_i1.p1 TRINITY_DN61_c2_g1~~TRINITY_DN61_c2_g1_i1.p1  ORF type:complete len:708 (-),score=217.01 TRINITY_DN61_c2_g1_i1:364-2487(-)